jgi:uncharacterized protein (DUF2132 family)
MTTQHPKDPLHGVTLERLLTHLVDHHGWEELGRRTGIRCFQVEPTLKSCLIFLRRTPWARKKVEELYLQAPEAPPRGA